MKVAGIEVGDRPLILAPMEDVTILLSGNFVRNMVRIGCILSLYLPMRWFVR